MTAPIPERHKPTMAICEAATKGPWEAVPETNHAPVDTPKVPDWFVLCGGPHELAGIHRRYQGERTPEVEAANAAFISHARTALPQAITEIAELEARNAELEGALREIARQWTFAETETKGMGGDYEAGYDAVVGIARAALKEPTPEEPADA